jgi:hypothetical protein
MYLNFNPPKPKFDSHKDQIILLGLRQQAVVSAEPKRRETPCDTMVNPVMRTILFNAKNQKKNSTVPNLLYVIDSLEGYQGGRSGDG